MMSKFLVLVIFCTSVSSLFAQMKYSIFGGNELMYTVYENKIYEGESTDIKHLKNTVRANSIFKDSSNKSADIVFTVLGGKAYKSGIIKPDSLLFYIKSNTLFFRTKTGKFRNAGVYNPKDNVTGMLVFFQGMETIAFFMAVNYFK